jgi:hypothetical protein
MDFTRAASLILALTTGCTGSSGDDGPDAASGDRPDALSPGPDAGEGLPDCPGAASSYAGVVFDPEAVEARHANPQNDFLVFRGNLNQEVTPDRLLIYAFHQLGVDTGTFPLPENRWGVEVCVDLERTTCARTLRVASGSLEVASVTGRMIGSLRNAVFVDDRGQPSCEARVGTVTFDELIECQGPGC